MEIDKDLVTTMAAQIGIRFKVIMGQFDNRKDDTLKHLAASSIHMAFFMKDFLEMVSGEDLETNMNEIENEFLDKCGCDMKNDIDK